MVISAHPSREKSSSVEMAPPELPVFFPEDFRRPEGEGGVCGDFEIFSLREKSNMEMAGFMTVIIIRETLRILGESGVRFRLRERETKLTLKYFVFLKALMKLLIFY